MEAMMPFPEYIQWIRFYEMQSEDKDQSGKPNRSSSGGKWEDQLQYMKFITQVQKAKGKSNARNR